MSLDPETLERFIIANCATAEERRKYALLQAAALMFNGSTGRVKDVVDVAEQLLAEIESRPFMNGHTATGRSGE